MGADGNQQFAGLLLLGAGSLGLLLFAASWLRCRLARPGHADFAEEEALPTAKNGL